MHLPRSNRRACRSWQTIVGAGLVGTAVVAGCGEPSAPSASPSGPTLSAIVTSPTDSVQVLAGRPLRFRVQVELDSTVVDPDSVRWTDDLGDLLGVGPAITGILNNVGLRTVSADIHYRDLRTSASHAVEVLQNFPPHLALDSTARGLYYATDTIHMSVNLTAQDGEGATVTWTARSMGLSATGYAVDWTPGNGTAGGVHPITVVAVDPEGHADTLTYPLRLVATDRIAWWRSYVAPHRHRPWNYDVTPLAIGSDGTLYTSFSSFMNNRGAVTAVSPAGDSLWTHTFQSDYLPTPQGFALAADGRLFATLDGGDGVALAPGGSVLWHTVRFGDYPHGRFALGADGALFAATDSALERVDPGTGEPLWTVASFTNPGAGPVVGPGDSVLAPFGHEILRAAPNGDSTSQPIPYGYLTWGIIAGDRSGAAYFATSYGQIEVMKVARDGSGGWAVTFPTGVLGEPVIGEDSTVYAAEEQTDGGVVTAIEHDGTVLRWWRTLERAPADGDTTLKQPQMALLADGTLWVTLGRTVYRLRTSDGSVVDSIGLTDGVSSPLAVGADGTLYFLTADNRLMAVTGGAPLAADAPWPVARGDNARTGRVH